MFQQSKFIKAKTKLDWADNKRDLNRLGLTLADYHTAQEILKEYANQGTASTFNGNVAKFFKKCGFVVKLDETLVNYIIGCEG